MAGRKGRACRARSWFLLKDSVIFVLVMCLLQMQVQLLTATNGGADDVTATPHLVFNSSSNSNNSNSISEPPLTSNSISNNSSSSSSSNRHSGNVIRESVVIPSSDPEREARLLYEKSLKEFDLAGIQTHSSHVSNTNKKDERTVRKICEVWVIRSCHCTGQLDRVSLTCRGLGILDVPLDVPPDVVNLDLGNNNITHLEANSFSMVPNLEELTLSDNIITKIDPEAFGGIAKLKRLALQNCGLKVIPGEAFERIPNLVSLQLNGNTLTSMDSASLKHLQKLRTLRLEGNLFYRIPTDALAGLRSLEALNLGSNLLTIISNNDLPRMPNLLVLLLKRNQLIDLSARAFDNLTSLKILELDDNLISSLPDGLSKLTHLQEFSASGNRIHWLNETNLPKSLQTIELRGNPLFGIRNSALQGMTRLRKLILSDVKVLRSFPLLDGCGMLEMLKLDRAGLTEVPVDLCKQVPRLRSLELRHNGLREIPDLTYCRELRLLDISNNRIESLAGRPFQGLKQMHDLLMSYNIIKSIPNDAFIGLPKLQLLDLEGNAISFIHEEAFIHFGQLEDLNLGNNIFPNLPSTGLQKLLHLKTFNNPRLKDFPAPDVFPKIQTLVLSYAYHCCPFLPLVAMSATRKPPLVQEAVFFPSDTDIDMSLWNGSLAALWPQLHNLSTKLGTPLGDFWDTFGTDFNYPGNLPPTYVEEYYEEDGGGPVRPLGSDVAPGAIQCLPLPGPFLPCADLFDWWTLRCGVWIVFMMALLGNGTVVFVLIFSRSKMDVPRFLVCNLAAADFFMGVYLGILAIVDAATLGTFRMYAIPWQMSVVCEVAGFLAVLSSELSVYTLAVITLERNYAITNAIHLNKRLSLKQATYIMVFGWVFALVMATLPLFGVSDYRKFAVCLPFETTNSIASLSYVIGLMVINGAAFLTLMGCYLKMYWAIRGSQAWNTNDSRIAKRMALLVFTDFLCWSPIAFFSVTAIFGLQLISLEQAKIFTVFVLPLNSCCNPFLYAIMTKQFKKDCVNICKAFEESRVTKTGGRCDRPARELPPLLPASHPPGCRCLRMMPSEMPKWHKREKKESLWSRLWKRIPCKRKKRKTENRRRTAHDDPYNYQFAEIKPKKPTRAGSISSENFCSSRSSSWRNGPAANHACAIPMKMMEPGRRRHSAWLITRKTSQDSNLSSSRNDSSASATTASTSTFRLSRSSAGSTTPLPSLIGNNNKQNSSSKPRLVRQEAVQEEEDCSPPRLGVRFLPTIPSAADSSLVMDEDSHDLSPNAQFYTVLQQTGVTKATLSSPNTQPTDKPP